MTPQTNSKLTADLSARARLRRWAGRAAVVLIALLVAGCAGEYPQTTISPQTDFGDVIQGLYVSVFWWTMIILAVVWIAMAYVLIRFRERPGQPRPKQVHGHLGLEIGWTIGPALIVVAIAIPTIQAVFRTQEPPPEGTYEVEVIGHRYWWEFRYPDGTVTANELHLPVGRPISLRLESADVIHSFWVPQLGGKRDVNPIRARPEGVEPDYNYLYFTIRTPGVYWGQCAEFCGESHSLMGMRVIAETEEEFEAWLQDMSEPAPTTIAEPDSTVQVVMPADLDPALVARGREVFHQSLCVVCHQVQGTTASAGVLGPDLTRLGSRLTLGAGRMENTQENLFAWIKDPESIKPGVLMPGTEVPGGGMGATGLSDDDVRAVAAYLSSMR